MEVFCITHGELLFGVCRLSTDDAPQLRRRMVTGVDELVEFGKRGVQRLDTIGKTLSDCIRTEIQTGFGGAHGFEIQSAHRRHVFGEDGVEPVDLALQFGLLGYQ